MSRPPHSPWFSHPNNIRWRIQAVKFIIMQFSPRSVFLPFRYKYDFLRFIQNNTSTHWLSWCSSVSLVTRLGAGRPGFDSRSLGPVQLPPQWLLGGGCSFPGGKVARAWRWLLASSI
jgi:hypothetical protein